jgi:hypothetical protein
MTTPQGSNKQRIRMFHKGPFNNGLVGRDNTVDLEKSTSQHGFENIQADV